jgi:hypothetical protein
VRGGGGGGGGGGKTSTEKGTIKYIYRRYNYIFYLYTEL